jgi:ATP-dependent Lhr-like helicase
MFITENQLTDKSGIVDNLRMELLQSLAMVRLLLADKWFEPADTQQFHFSTLLHQVLALIAQWGGIRADQIYPQLCKSGPFSKVKVSHFKRLLQHMGEQQLLTQLSRCELVLGIKGERVVDHYSFYAVFKTPEEYRIIAKGKTLGTLPIDSPVMPGQHMVFGGRRWQIQEIDSDKKCIYVIATRGGKPPNFGGEGMVVHDRVRQEMFAIYCAGDYRIPVGDQYVDFIDNTAKSLFTQGYDCFNSLDLANQCLIQQGERVCIISWLGDKKVNTLVMLLIIEKFAASAFAGVIEVEKAQAVDVKACLIELLNQTPPTNAELAQQVPDKHQEKYDDFLPESLLCEGYGQRAFDVVGALAWVRLAFVDTP